MSPLVHRSKKAVAEPITEQPQPKLSPEELYRLEGIERAQTRQRMEREERDERERTIAASQALTPKSIDPVAQAEAQAKAIKDNPSRVIPARTNAEVAKEHAERYPYKYEATSDPLMDREPVAVQRQMGYVPPVLKPSITLQPQPAPRPYGERTHMPREIPLTGAEARAAELQQRPTPVYAGPMKTCAGCSASVASNLEWHMRGDRKCYVDAAKK